MAQPALDSDRRTELLGPSWKQFADDCGLHGTLRLVVRNTETGQVENYDFETPYVLIGESAHCQLRLRHPEVSYRHAYLQVVGSRLYGFDLESQTGTYWGPTARPEGIVTLETLLQIGPYTIRVSRAPVMTQSLVNWDDESELSNAPINHVRLRFANATGRRSGSQLKPIRRVTLLGRSGRCHVKLSDPSVSKVHASLVCTDSGFWVVDLGGRSPVRLNERELPFGPFGGHDRLGIGRFQMQLHSSGDDSTFQRSAPSINSVVETAAEGERTESGLLIRSRRKQLAMREADPGSLPAPSPAQSPAPVALTPDSVVTESTLLSVMEHFSRMQEQLMAHAEQQMLTLAQLFSAVHREQQETVLEQLRAIQAITSELRQLRDPAAVPVPPGSAFTATTLEPPALPTADAPNSAAAASGPRLESGPLIDDVASLPSGSLPSVEVEPADNVVVDTESAEASADDADDSQSAPRAAGSPANAAGVRSGQFGGATAHVWITQRINELERERNSRWSRLMQLVRGGGP